MRITSKIKFEEEIDEAVGHLLEAYDYIHVKDHKGRREFLNIMTRLLEIKKEN
jgi:hypothetical protein